MVGRPTLYQPEYCERVIALGKEGASIAAMACEFDVSRESLYEWGRVHPEFSDALTRARENAQVYWERKGELGIEADKFNGGVWAKIVGCRFPDYQDRNKVELSGAGGGPVQMAVAVNVHPVRARND